MEQSDVPRTSAEVPPCHQFVSPSFPRSPPCLVSPLSCARNAQRGLVIGTAGGAVLGGVIGKVSGSTAKGAIIGAAVGGAAGAIIGDQMDRQAAELEQKIPGATVERVGEGIAGDLRLRPALRLRLRRGQGRLPATTCAPWPRASRSTPSRTSSSWATPTASARMLQQDALGAPGRCRGRVSDVAGVARSRIATGGLGEDEPVASNADDAGRRRNRRVEVAIYASKELREEAQRQAAS